MRLEVFPTVEAPTALIVCGGPTLRTRCMRHAVPPRDRFR